ncbi:recombinase family protein [Actinobacteria bacterium YIM 96077]|uniref:Serine recombinase n=1 Tax=Phytoactinopolyspora halophila TaxID=1981511 RepID=A0A329QLQ8_9ACTN|nr:recombinase family protein [Actinobacteria bacterium YIM 96077]RAW13297.1 serine recombinase [Phytoactinopolyspora halophila]
MRFAFYGRCSTEDAQDPESSRGWQVRRAQQLIDPHGGEIVAEYFDIGQSRSLPWKRRAEASRLLDDITNPARPFTELVIGEPQRAFYGAQFALTFPVLTHHGVSLWVPEVGGRIDPGSEGHDLVMALFGGMSKGERMRIQKRVKDAMANLAETTDRHLAGRPPYGYQLVDAGEHPNPAKAALGQRLRRLEPDPVTATVVKEIFTMYRSGMGLRAIAQHLTDVGHPSPSQHDPRRNPHRDQRGWAHSAVRAILVNPVYTGVRVWGKQEKFEALVDPDDVAAGYQTKMRWRRRDSWSMPDHKSHEPLVDDDLFTAVQTRIASRSKPGTTRAMPAKRSYALSGLLFCGQCGLRMQAGYHKSRHANGRGWKMYRCIPGRRRSITPDMTGHPSSLYVREDEIISKLDPWLATLASPEWLHAAQEPSATHDAHIASLRKQIADRERKIRNLVDAIEEASGDMALLTEKLAQRTHERDHLKEELRRATQKRTAADQEIEELIAHVGGITSALAEATPEERAELYPSLGLKLTYNADPRQVNVEVDLARVAWACPRGDLNPHPLDGD